MNSFRALSFFNRHRASAEAIIPKIVEIAIEGGSDPGSFRAADVRDLEPGAIATHVIKSAIFANTKFRSVITAHSDHSDEVAYRAGDVWSADIHSKVAGAERINDFNRVFSNHVSSPSTPAETSNAGDTSLLGEAHFQIGHLEARECDTLPHPIRSRVSAAGYHPRVNVAAAFNKNTIEESSAVRCRASR